MKLFSHPFFLLVSPCLLLMAAVLFQVSLQPFVKQYGPLLIELPYFLLLVAAFVNYRFNQWRLFYAASLLLIAYFVIRSLEGSELTLYQDELAYHFLSVFVPLNLLVLMLRPERSLFSLGGLRRVLTLVMQFSAVFALLVYQEHSQPYLEQYFNLWGTEQVIAPARTMLFNCGLISLSLIYLNYKKGLNEACFTVLLCACLISSIFFLEPLMNTVLYGACALILLQSVISNSHKMAFQDQLTQIPGRRALEDKLKTIGSRYCIAMTDVDYFKKFNDTHGHDVGDEVLRVVADTLSNITGGGTAYRYGGEEFTLLFPRKSLQQVREHLEAIREEMANKKIYLRDKEKRPVDNRKGQKMRKTKLNKPHVNVQISIGVAEANEDDNSPFDVIKRADRALYHAKANGRNRVSTENQIP